MVRDLRANRIANPAGATSDCEARTLAGGPANSFDAAPDSFADFTESPAVILEKLFGSRLTPGSSANIPGVTPDLAYLIGAAPQDRITPDPVAGPADHFGGAPEIRIAFDGPTDFLGAAPDLFQALFEAKGLSLGNECETGHGRRSHGDGDSHNQSYE